MALTYPQKMASTILSLQNYRNNLPANDPEIPTIDEHLVYRDDLKAYGASCTSLAKGGPGSNPPGNPPPPPTT